MPLSSEGRRYLEQAPEVRDAGKTKIPVRRFGSGEPVLFIHGWPFSGFIWRKILPRLAERHECLVIDLPGAGGSDWQPDNDFSFHGHADNLRRVVDALGLERYRIVAHDTGATVARRLAVVDPRVAQLVCIDTEIPGHRPPLVPFLVKLMSLPGSGWVFRRLLGSRAYLRSSAGFGGCFCDLSLIDGEFHEQLIAPLIASPRATEGQIRYAQGIDWAQLDALAEEHGRIMGEVLFLWGEQDPFFPVDRAREMIPQLRRCAGLIAIPATKLLPHEERPEVVAGHVLEFFGRPAA